MAGLKQIMEIFMTINQPLSSEQRVRWYKQKETHAGRFPHVSKDFFIFLSSPRLSPLCM